MNGKNLIRQGGTPIGYFDGENAVMDSADNTDHFLNVGCRIHRLRYRSAPGPGRPGGTLAERPGGKAEEPGTECALCAPGAGLSAEAGC